MNKLLLLGLTLALLPGLTLAQRSPKAKTKAKPAAKVAGPYFQQEVKYSIDVRLDDKAHFLRGKEELTYINNSPQALPFIWFHLWPNAYRDNHTAFGREQQRQGNRNFLFAKPERRGFIDSLSFVVNGQAAKLEYDPANPDLAKLLLPQPLAPGATATIATPFRVKLPGSFSRMGHVGQSYQVSQWFPKPAVLDRRGWHPIPYLSQGEFYSEYGSFDVSITLPSNYTVGATGELQNPDERARLAELATATAAKTTAEAFSHDLKFPASAPTTKTLRYRQDRVHDFAWFADKRFNVLQDTVRLPSGRTVQTMVLFTNRQPVRWIKGLEEVNTALRSYSRWVGEYPYSAVTAVDGALTAGSGMEYPMVTVTEPGAIIHEVGHNWFYGILGSNERDFPWMDEGVNTYEHTRTEALSDPMAGVLPEMSKQGLTPARQKTFGLEGLPAPAFNQLPYQIAASHGADQPVQGPSSAAFTSFNYGGGVYFKTASLLRYLAGYLGQEKFDDAMRLYYTRWQFRHPYPEDMQAVFEESTGQKLGWFFGDMLGGTQHYDADLSAVALFSDVVKVLVRTDSEVPWAVPVSSLDAQGNVLETLWTPPFGNLDANAEEEATSQLNFKRANVASLVVDAGYLTPQLNRRNDHLKLEGPLARTEPLRLRPLLSVERWDRKTISWLPVLGANTSDKFMLGAAFYNDPLAPRPLQYLAMPMYSFNRNELNGIGRIQLNDLPHSKARRFVTSFTVQRFERYLKLEPAFTFYLPHRVGASVQHQASLALTSVRDQDRSRTSSIYSVEYGARHEDALNHWSAHVELNQLEAAANSPNSAVLLRAEARYLRYYSRSKRVQARLFGGRFLQGPAQSDFVLGLSGSPDYRRQTPFFDRQQISPTLAAQTHQTDGRDGSFRAFLPVASTSWLSTLNLQADLPITKLAVFADFGATGETQFLTGRPQGQRLFYDAGLTVPFFGEIVQLYIPVAGSQFQNGTPESRQDFTDGIRFQIHFEKLNPFKLLDEAVNK